MSRFVQRRFCDHRLIALVAVSSTLRAQRILLVEDAVDIREMWRLWLTFRGFHVDAAGDGAEALRLASVCRPDLVLMDLWMPIMDGVEAIRRLRARPSTADVPIIAITADTSTTAVERARASGCDQFVAKPVMPEELLDHIRAALRPRKRRRP